jgi:hypothetical protein
MSGGGDPLVIRQPPRDQSVVAHDQAISHRYVMHFPPHPSRPGDPHYKAFEAYRRKNEATAACYVGARIGTDHCLPGPLELHHAHIEFSLQNGVDPVALAKDFPGIHPDATPDEIDAWVETEPNFRWLCAYHHRGAAGAHTSAHADWEAALYVRNLIGPPK